MALPGVNPTFRYLDDGAPDGTIFGQTITSKLAFWAATVTTQPTATQQAVCISTAAVSQAGTIHGYATSTQADGIVRLVNQLRNDLVQIGIIKGS